MPVFSLDDADFRRRGRGGTQLSVVEPREITVPDRFHHFAHGRSWRGFALYPGLLRLNLLTDTAGTQPHEYVMRDDVRLEPHAAGLRTTEFKQGREYWRQFKPGSPYTLYLRRGGLGFYQIDLAPVYAEIRAFYERCDTCSPPHQQVNQEAAVAVDLAPTGISSRLAAHERSAHR